MKKLCTGVRGNKKKDQKKYKKIGGRGKRRAKRKIKVSLKESSANAPKQQRRSSKCAVCVSVLFDWEGGHFMNRPFPNEGGTL